MSEGQKHRMSEAEIRLWGKAAEAAAPAVKKAREPSAAAKSQRVMEAAQNASADEMRAILADGCSANARARNQPRYSAIAVALMSKNDGAALALLEAGGLTAPLDWGGSAYKAANDAFSEAVASGVFKDLAFEREIKRRTLALFKGGAGSWGLIKRARDALDPSAPLDELAAWSAVSARWHIAMEALRDGVSLKRSWRELGLKRAHSASSRGAEDREAFLSAFKDAKAVDQLDEKSCSFLFRAACFSSDAALLKAMLNAGLRPSEDWTVELDEQWSRHTHGSKGLAEGADQRVSILIFAAGREGPEAYDLLKTCEPAVRAATARVDGPWHLRGVAISRLMELSAMGCRVDGVDPLSQNALHIWAKLDVGARAGWATIAREFPHMMTQKDHEGFSGAARMLARLASVEERDAFNASLSRIESREIRKEIPREKAKASTPKRSRL